MKNLRSLLLLAFVVVLAISCQKEIDFRDQTPPGQIYANCILNPDSIFRVFVSYSVPLTAPASYNDQRIEEAKDALVIINDGNGLALDTLELVEHVIGSTRFLVFESTTNMRPMPNQSYGLDVSEPNFPKRRKFRSTCRVPALLAPISVDTFTPKRMITQNNYTFGFEVYWNDPVPGLPNTGTDNYFIIEAVYQNTDLTLGETEYIRSELYTLDDVSDNGSIGKTTDTYLYTFVDDSKMPPPANPPIIRADIAVLASTFDNWRIDLGQNFTSNILIKVHHVDFYTYRYYREVETYRKSTGTDIFAQPVEVHGNEEGGLGFFGGESLAQYSIQFQ